MAGKMCTVLSRQHVNTLGFHSFLKDQSKAGVGKTILRIGENTETGQLGHNVVWEIQTKVFQLGGQGRKKPPFGRSQKKARKLNNPTNVLIHNKEHHQI